VLLPTELCVDFFFDVGGHWGHFVSSFLITIACIVAPGYQEDPEKCTYWAGDQAYVVFLAPFYIIYGAN